MEVFQNLIIGWCVDDPSNNDASQIQYKKDQIANIKIKHFQAVQRVVMRIAGILKYEIIINPLFKIKCVSQNHFFILTAG